MRIGVFGDIHGNSIALDAVLDDITANGGVDAYICLGDLCALGSDPVGVLQRLDALRDLACIRGNTDRYLLSSDRPAPPDDDEQRRLMMAGFRWSRERVEEAGALERLRELPLDHRRADLDAVFVHASPGSDDGKGFKPDHTDAECRERLAGADARLVVVGHTHIHVDRVVDGVRVFNPGSISNHPRSESQACYAVLEIEEGGYTITQRRVAYDKGKAIETLHASGFPAADYVASLIGS